MTDKERTEIYAKGYQDGWEACAQAIRDASPKRIGFGAWMKSKVPRVLRAKVHR